MLRQISGLIAAGAVATELLSVCGVSGPPSPEPANNTLAQVEHNLGYGNTLAHLALKQTVHVALPNANSELNLYNFTNLEINPRTLARVVDFYANLSEQTPTWKFPIQYGIAQHPTTEIDAVANPNFDSEHDVVVVPDGTPAPALFEDQIINGVHPSETVDFPDGTGQTISVVYEDDYVGDGSTDFQSDGLPTELCQSLMSVTSSSKVNSGLNVNIVDRLTQEDACNTWGNSIAILMSGANLSTYETTQNGAGGPILYDGVPYNIKEFTLSPSYYEEAQQQLLGEKG